MKVLHSSDWHIGRMLYGRKRYDEFEAFLNWLAKEIEEQGVDVLLVAGDIFDTSTPSNLAQQLYYQFLHKVAASCCRHIVIIAGNHDSPTFLDAPAGLLKSLNVHVIGRSRDNVEDEVLTLHNAKGEAELIVCAVPYLHDRDIRSAEAGESLEDKEQKLLAGIKAHYAATGQAAEAKRAALEADIPIIGMGHLFAAGGERVEGDGVRELYIGSLAHITAHIFPACFDYTALGHLHVPQRVNKKEHIRYSGSPLPMGFGEARQQKSLCLVEFADRAASVILLPVPTFQKLAQIGGELADIRQKITELATEHPGIWLEVTYTGDEIIGDLNNQLGDHAAKHDVEILRINNRPSVPRALEQQQEGETLDELSDEDVFQRCMAAHDIPEEQRKDLLLTYREALSSFRDRDIQAD